MGRRVQRRRAPRRVLGLAHPAEGVALGVAGVLVAATLYSAVSAPTGGTGPSPSTATPTSSVTLDSEDVAGYPSRLLLSQPTPERPAGSGVRAVQPPPPQPETGADPAQTPAEPPASPSDPTPSPSASTSAAPTAEPTPGTTPSEDPGGSTASTDATSTTAPKPAPEPSTSGPEGAADGAGSGATDSADASAAHPPVADSAAAQGPVEETSGDEALAGTVTPEAPPTS